MVLRARPNWPTSVWSLAGSTRWDRSPAVMPAAVVAISSNGCRPRRSITQAPAASAPSRATAAASSMRTSWEIDWSTPRVGTASTTTAPTWSLGPPRGPLSASVTSTRQLPPTSIEAVVNRRSPSAPARSSGSRGRASS
jgi:hypothetical protein